MLGFLVGVDSMLSFFFLVCKSVCTMLSLLELHEIFHIFALSFYVLVVLMDIQRLGFA